MQYLVKIVNRDTLEVVESLGPMPRSTALRVERGVNINLNHDDYFTKVLGDTDEPNGEQNTNSPSK